MKANLNEENIYTSFYNNPCIYKCLGKEMCIALDVALAEGGCEATQEKRSQGNCVLVQRAIVDWTIPDLMSCPKTIQEIARLYTEGDVKPGLAKHRGPIYFDERERAARRHEVSKVVDWLRKETPRCPHVVNADCV